MTIIVGLPALLIFALSIQPGFYSGEDMLLGPVTNLQQAEAVLVRREGDLQKKIGLLPMSGVYRAVF